MRAIIAVFLILVAFCSTSSASMFSAKKSSFVPNSYGKDPYWQYTSLLLGCEGTNGGTTFTDSTGLNTITTHGTPALSSTTAPFGTTACYFDGSTPTYLGVPNSTATTLGSGKWTVECWMYPIDLTTPGGLTFYDKRSTNDYASSVLTISSAGAIRVNVVTAGGNWAYANWDLTSNTIAINNWYHVAVTYDGSVMRGFINGVMGSNTLSVTGMTQSTAATGIGTYATQYYYKWRVKDYRVTKGIARYTASFPVPTGPAPTHN